MRANSVHSISVGALRRRAEWFARREATRRLTEPFSIVSDDCWGGELYTLAGRPFLTPFVGLFHRPGVLFPDA